MSKLDELLQGVKVEWLPLKEIAELQRGKTITAKNKTEGNIPVISGGQKPAYYNGEFNRTDETITIAGSGAYAGYISYWNEPIFVSDAFSIKPDLSILNIKYAYYFLLTKQEWIYSLKKGAGIPHVYPKDLEKLQIPIPCPDNPEKSLEIQQEIVRVLDELTSLTNQLTTELETERQNRKKQFEFYRDQLLSHDDFEWIALKNVCSNFIVPMRDRPKVFDGEIPWCRIEDIDGKYFNGSKSGLGVSKEVISKMNLKVFPKGTVICSCSASIGSYAINSIPLITNQTFIGLVCDDILYNKYLLYFMETQTDNLLKLSTKGTIPYISRKKFEDLKILLPYPNDPQKSIEIQQKIVKLLDQLDATHTAIQEEITKEIKLRTQQYEYYREKLLSFPSLRTT